jgi:hypothetical protein
MEVVGIERGGGGGGATQSPELRREEEERGRGKRPVGLIEPPGQV